MYVIGSIKLFLVGAVKLAIVFPVEIGFFVSRPDLHWIVMAVDAN